jgi:hypothetical protein
MSTNNSSHASQPATLNLFGSDGRVEALFVETGELRLPPPCRQPQVDVGIAHAPGDFHRHHLAALKSTATTTA